MVTTKAHVNMIVASLLVISPLMVTTISDHMIANIDDVAWGLTLNELILVAVIIILVLVLALEIMDRLRDLD